MSARTKLLAIGSLLLLVALLVVWLALGDEPVGPAALPVDGPAPQATGAPGLPEAGPGEPALLAPQGEPVVPGSPEDRANLPPATGRLVVRVTWAADGQPAASLGVTAIFWDGPDPLRNQHRGLTDVAGVLEVADVPPGTVGVYLDRANGDNAEVRAGETTELSLAIPPGILVRGQVTDADERPVAGAGLRLGMDSGEEGHLVARSDADGRFALRDVREHAMVGAQAEGHVPSPLALVRGAPGQVMEVTLVLGPAGAALAGRVLDARGQPVAGAEVLVGPPRGWPLPGHNSGVFDRGPPPRRVFADGQGAFAVGDLPPGHWPLAARHAGFSPWLGQCELQAGLTLDQDVVLPDAAVLAGVVRDDSGRPVPDASVTCGDYAEMDWQETRCAADGRYELSGLPLGGISVRASAKDVGKDEWEVVARAGERLEWDPVLTLGLGIVGRVVDEGGVPAVGHHVDAAHHAPGRTITSQAVTDAQGRFTLVNCADGEHELRVHTPDWKSSVAVVRGVRPGPEEVVVTIFAVGEPSAFLVGRLLDTAGEVPAQATVAAADVRTGNGEIEALDATGAFRCGPLRPGAWDLVAIVKGFPNHPLGRFDLVAGETRDVGTVLLSRPGRLVVHASLPSGAEGGRCFCQARSSEGRDAGPFTLLDGVAPAWTSGPLPPGEYEVVLGWASGGPDDVFIVPVRARARVEEGRDTRVDLVAQRGVAASARLHSARLPGPKARAMVTDASGREVLVEEVVWYSFEQEGPDDDAWVSFTELPGTYTLRVECDGVVLAERVLELPAGVNVAPDVVVELP